MRKLKKSSERTEFTAHCASVIEQALVRGGLEQQPASAFTAETMDAVCEKFGGNTIHIAKARRFLDHAGRAAEVFGRWRAGETIDALSEAYAVPHHMVYVFLRQEHERICSILHRRESIVTVATRPRGAGEHSLDQTQADAHSAGLDRACARVEFPAHCATFVERSLSKGGINAHAASEFAADVMGAVCLHFGGSLVYVPRGRTDRRRLAAEMFARWRAGETVADLGDAYQVTKPYVYMLLNQEQARLRAQATRLVGLANGGSESAKLMHQGTAAVHAVAAPLASQPEGNQ